MDNATRDGPTPDGLLVALCSTGEVVLDYHVTADSLSEMYPTKIRGHMKDRRSCDAKVPKAMRAATWEVVSPLRESFS